MESAPRSHRRRLIAVAVFVAAIVLGLLAYLRRKRRAAKEAQERGRIQEPPAIPSHIQGLSEAEAAARRPEGQESDNELEASRSRGEIWRENVLTIFNLDLLGMAIVLWLLGDPLGALGSLGVMFLNIGLNVAQELLAEKKLAQLALATRPTATVIREGKVRSIDPGEIVVEDVLMVGPGDRVLVDGEIIGDGQIVVDESMLTGKGYRLSRRAGDMLHAGSFCVTGRAAYEAREVSAERLIEVSTGGAQRSKRELTPLEQIMNRILQVLLLIVACLSTLLLVQFFRSDLVILNDFYRNAISIIFSIAPSSLFFMILVTYAVGTADMAKLGALVRRAQSIESLAQVSVLCFSKTGILTGMRISLETVDPPAGYERLSENRIHHILGDYAHSTWAGDFISKTLSDTFAGDRRPMHEETPYLSVYGWSGIAFDDDDLHGVYVLGDPDVLQPYLAADEATLTDAEEEAPKPSAWRRFSNRVGRLFKRSKQTPKDQSTQPIVCEPKARPPQDVDEQPSPADSAPAEEEAPKRTIFAKFLNRVKRVFRRSEQAPDETPAAGEAPPEQAVLLFAYRPEVSPLYDASKQPQLPADLIPLCFLRFSERIRPEAKETIRAFSESGVEIKVLSSNPRDTVAATARQLGLGERDEMPLRTVSGLDLATGDEAEFARSARDMTVFGRLTPEQKGEVVRTLCEEGHLVAMVGDGVNDVPALTQANLGVATRSGSQVALSVADIVLLTGSLKDLSQVLRKGQCILNGLLDLLKLYLTQILYLLLFIVAFAVSRTSLPYTSAQASIISIVTLTLPSIALSLWASAGALPKGSMSGRLARFVLPAAILTSVFGLAIYHFFLATTGDTAYAQLAMTYALVAFGLLLVLFVQPPTKAWVGADVSNGDRRLTWLVVGLFVVFLLFSRTRLAPRFFDLVPLRRAADYLVIGVVVVVWAFVLRTTWRARHVGRYLYTKLGGLISIGARTLG